MLALGVPDIDVQQDMSDYFEWHHTDGDTADKLDVAAMTKTTAVFATLVEGIANDRRHATARSAAAAEALDRFPRPRPALRAPRKARAAS